MASPSVTAIVPTFDNAASLDAALRSLARQRYDGDVELLIVDGGSTDDTLAIAGRHGARVVPNPLRHEEEARALGLEAATGELVLLLDADNELVGDAWLARLVAPLQAHPDVVSADCLYHAWRAEDPPVTRLCALIGGTDPLAIELGWGDRWASHLQRWTGMPLPASEERDGVLVVTLDPDRPPPMGSNGFLVRREALLATQYRPFVHSDVVGDLAAAGWRFARVREAIVHHYAPTLRLYARKARRRARRTTRSEPVQRRGFRPPPARLALQALWSASLVGPAVLALRGYGHRRDSAWVLYPILSAVTVWSYAAERLRSPSSRR